MKKDFPILFVGHGSPMNAIEPSRFNEGWREMGRRLGKPDVIIAISAHWYTHGLLTSDAALNNQVFDMYGFPRALYEVEYAPAGDPALARRIEDVFGKDMRVDDSWGVDHGIWSVLCNMYPEADVPVVTVSIDADRTPAGQYEVGRRLGELKGEGVMILASGNVVHNLRLVDWNSDRGAPWAEEFDRYIEEAITRGRPEDAVEYVGSGLAWDRAIPTPDHYYPLLVALGAAGQGYHAEVFNRGCELGSMSMTSYLLETA